MISKKPIVFVVLAMAGLFVLASGQAHAQAQIYRFSVDIGGNEDLSDPTIPVSNWMDCGDIYLEGNPGPAPPPTLVKDDDGPVLPNYTGHPFIAGGAPQPPPALVGAGAAGVDPTSQYSVYFDLDAEDQLGFEIYAQPGGPPIAIGTNWAGVHLEPTRIDFSYEDDGPPGWFVTPGDIPTTAAPDHGDVAAKDEIMIDIGPFGGWSPPTITGVRSELDLGFAWAPPDPNMGNLLDDDVDALDKEEHQYFYWSPDHEANMGLDPGSIYMTDLFWAGANQFQVIDDVANLGIPEDTDVDAWEFCAVTKQTYQTLFGAVPAADFLLIGLYSVDSDDPGTLNVNESGGMNPNQIYASNLVGMSVGMAIYAEDIDALTVPEPMTLALLALGGVAVLRRRRR